MQTAELRPRDKDWLAYGLPAIGFCLFDGLAPCWLCRCESPSILALSFGAFAAQLLWGAAWCALGPGRWIRRFVAAIALGTVAGGTALGGICLAFDAAPPPDPIYHRGPITIQIRRIGPVQRQPGPREQAREFVQRFASVLPLALWVAQLPWFCCRALSGWQIGFRPIESRAERADPRKFGVADLLAVTAGIALALGFWRINLLIGDEDFYPLRWIIVCVVLSFVGGAIAIPVVPFALGRRPLRLGFAYACTYLIAIVMALGFLLLIVNARQERLDALYVLSVFLAAAVVTMHLSFWIARDVGYRLVRAPRRRPALRNEAASAD